MKIIRYLFLLALMALLHGCEDVVDVNLNTAAPRLVVDASIDWVKGTDGNQQKIRLTTTTGYYNPEIPTVSGATVVVTNSTGTAFNFEEGTTAGDYFCNNFVPVIDETYTLTINYLGETYTAQETLKSVTEIGNVVQDNSGGFLNDQVEVKFFFQDDPAAENYYLVKYTSDMLMLAQYDLLSDEFINGNQSFSQFSDEDLEQGNVLNIHFYGISKGYYEYMSKLLSIAGSGSQGPFGTTPAKVHGNLVNTTNPGNYALGFFRLSEVDTLAYTVQ